MLPSSSDLLFDDAFIYSTTKIHCLRAAPVQFFCILILVCSPHFRNGANAGGGGEGIVGEDLGRVGLQVGGDFGEENRAVFGQFFLAHAAEVRESPPYLRANPFFPSIYHLSFIICPFFPLTFLP